MSKIKDPKQSKPVMGVTPDELVSEFLRLDGDLQQCQKLIQMANNTIKEQQQVGQVLMGKLDILARQLNGMDIDPRNYQPEVEESSPEEDTFAEENAENTPETPDSKGDPRVTAITDRFNR